jgi:Photosynthesis system II assembly factor YCF48
MFFPNIQFSCHALYFCLMVMLKQLLILFFLNLFFYSGDAQQIKLLDSGKSFSLRGLCAVSDQTLWVSGSSGSVGLSTDGGQNWKWISVPGYEKSDFRDIEAFSDQEALIMGITNPAVILRTTDGGKSWIKVFVDTAKSAFLDAMYFFGDQGAIVGDPESGKIFFAETADGGKIWNKKNPWGPRPSAPADAPAVGESFFAASGSNLVLIPRPGYVSRFANALVSGGKKSCLYYLSGRYPLLINQGAETTGANSIALDPSDPNRAFVVGGDFSHDTLRYRNSLRIRLDPFSQESPLDPPHGYRSCVEYLNDNQMICCGTTGVDISNNGGMNWKLISNKGFHVCRKSKTGRSIFLAGAHGIIGRLEPWPIP